MADTPREPGRRTVESGTSGAPRILARGTDDLLQQVAWFNRLRLVGVAGIVVLTLFAWLAGGLTNPQPLYVLAGITLVVDLVYLAWFPRLRTAQLRGVRHHVDVQIAVDLVILTAILHYSGGITNPVTLFYLFHAFIAALLLSVKAALVVVGASLTLAGALALSERQGWLTHHRLSFGWVELEHASPFALIVWLGVFATVLVCSVYFVATVLDLLVKREAQLIQADRQLAHSEKLASIGKLAAGVAHEINNPVGVIQSKVEILRHRIADGDSVDRLLDELDTAEKHLQRIRGVTEGLLAFSRESPFSLTSLDLGALAREGVELVSVPFRAAAVPLQLAELHAVTVLGSHNHLLQVLVNLLLNAKDASPAGSMVTVRTVVTEDAAALVVEDLGAGIQPEHLSQIFDPFFTTKDVGRGTGLGLAVSHGIVKKHGGRIIVRSRVGEGSVFEVWLRRAEQAADQSADPPPDPAADRAPRPPDQALGQAPSS